MPESKSGPERAISAPTFDRDLPVTAETVAVPEGGGMDIDDDLEESGPENQQVEAEINAILAERRAFRNAVPHPICVLILGIVLWSPQSGPALIALFLLVTMAIVYNQILLWYYWRSTDRVVRSRFWRRRFVESVAMVGAAWGVGCTIVYVADPTQNGFVITVLAAVAAVGSITYSVVPMATIFFTICIMGPITMQSLILIAALASGASAPLEVLAMAPFSAIFGIFVSLFAVSTGKHLRELISRRQSATRAGEELDAMVRERTRELTARSAELAREKNRAEEASAAKSRFLANVSHELRTPLNAILGFSEMVKQELFGPVGNLRYRDYAGDIHKSAEHLLSIINDLLDLSKIEAGKHELHLESIDLKTIATECLRLVEDQAQAKGLRVESTLMAATDVLLADERAIAQIVTNLLSNAIKFTPDGGKIWIKTEGTALHGITIEVGDSGIGMSEAEIARCLKPFEQIDSDMARRYKGTGLGLPIVKGLTDLHGGRFALDSKIGQGTTVRIWLPALSFPAQQRQRG